MVGLHGVPKSRRQKIKSDLHQRSSRSTLDQSGIRRRLKREAKAYTAESTLSNSRRIRTRAVKCEITERTSSPVADPRRMISSMAKRIFQRSRWLMPTMGKLSSNSQPSVLPPREASTG